MSRLSPRQSAFMALLFLVVAWAYTWVVIKQAMRYAGPLDFVALRYAGAAIVLVVIMLLRRESLRPTPLRLTIAVGLCQTTAFPALSQLALVAGNAGRVSLLAYTMPFWVVVLAWGLLGERPGMRQWLALVLAAAGLTCVMEPWKTLASIDSAMLALVSGIAWALAVVFTKRMFRRHAPSMLAFTTWQMIFGTVVLGAVALLVPSRQIQWSPAFIYELGYCVFLATSMAWLLWAYVVKTLPTAVAGLSSLGVPLVTLFMAWGLLHERPGSVELIGMGLILAGLLIVTGVRVRRRSRLAPG